MDAKNIVKALETLSEACDTIEDASKCEQCPLGNLGCLEGSFFVSEQTIDKFLKLAKECEDSWSEENCIAYYADMERKLEAEERTLGEIT